MNGLPDKAWFNVAEVAMYLDSDEGTIRRWIAHKKIKAHKLPGGIKIARETIEKLIKESLIDPFK